MEKIFDSIAQQAPDLAALVIIVLIFVRYMEKRDEVIKAITAELRTIAETLTAHRTETNDAIEEMHRITGKSGRSKHRT